jgi:hypothetical protein
MNKFEETIFYPLKKDFEKEFFAELKHAVINRYQFIGDKAEKEYFIKCLLCLQMLNDYRAPLISVKENLSAKTDLNKINSEIKKLDFEFDYSWAVWERDKEMGLLAENLFTSEVEIIGSDSEFNELVLRYLISIWLIDWEGPLYAILNSITKNRVELKELNELLKKWDFTLIFNDN